MTAITLPKLCTWGLAVLFMLLSRLQAADVNEPLAFFSFLPPCPSHTHWPGDSTTTLLTRAVLSISHFWRHASGTARDPLR